MIASPNFQAFAAWFPLTRPIAHRHATALFDLTAGFVYSQVLLAAVQLDVFSRLAPGPQTPERLAVDLHLPKEATLRLLKAGASLGLFDRFSGQRFGLGPLGAALLALPSLKSMIAHHQHLYEDLADPVALLKGTHRSRALHNFWSYASRADASEAAPEAVAAYSTLMAETQALIAGPVLAAYDFSRHQRLLDIGCGEGAFAIAAARAAPSLKLAMVDLPNVLERARIRLGEAQLMDRAVLYGSDFRRDPLPPGSDLITLVRVLHDHDDDVAAALLASARAALAPGGTLLIAEPMADTPGAAGMGEAYFGFYLLAMGSGRPRTPKEIMDLCRTAGFATATLRSTRQPLLARVILARP